MRLAFRFHLWYQGRPVLRLANDLVSTRINVAISHILINGTSPEIRDVVFATGPLSSEVFLSFARFQAGFLANFDHY